MSQLARASRPPSPPTSDTTRCANGSAASNPLTEAASLTATAMITTASGETRSSATCEGLDHSTDVSVRPPTQTTAAPKSANGMKDRRNSQAPTTTTASPRPNRSAYSGRLTGDSLPDTTSDDNDQWSDESRKHLLPNAGSKTVRGLPNEQAGTSGYLWRFGVYWAVRLARTNRPIQSPKVTRAEVAMSHTQSMPSPNTTWATAIATADPTRT